MGVKGWWSDLRLARLRFSTTKGFGTTSFVLCSSKGLFLFKEIELVHGDWWEGVKRRGMELMTASGEGPFIRAYCCWTSIRFILMMVIWVWLNEMKIKTSRYFVITVGTTSCLLFRPKCRLIVRWPRVSWTGKTRNSKVIWHWKIDLNFCGPFRRYWMQKVGGRMIIIVYTRVTSEFVRAGKAFFTRGISTDEGFFACVSSYVSGLKDDKRAERGREGR